MVVHKIYKISQQHIAMTQRYNYVDPTELVQY